MSRRSTPYLATGALLLLSACAPDRVAAPRPGTEPSTELAPVPVDAGRVAAVADAVADFRHRVLPTLSGDVEALDTATAALEVALATHDAVAAARALAASAREASRLAGERPELAAELSVLTLAVDRSALQASPLPH